MKTILSSAQHGLEGTIDLMAKHWDAGQYQNSYGFVRQFGKDVLAMLAPQPGESILDAGCGTGQLTAEIAQSGANVLGVDASREMIVQARQNFPNLQFAVEDLRELPFEAQFDAVFSNAVLHWVQPAGQAAAAIARALKPGGRFVAELGGCGNVAQIVAAAEGAWKLVADGPPPHSPWYYPTLGEYASLLEFSGLEVTFATLFDRPTPLEGGSEGLARWYDMFGRHWTNALPAEARAGFVAAAVGAASPGLLRDGQWTADYRRLRVTARKL